METTRSFLTFRMAATLGSFGSQAAAETRESWSRPGRSAVLGVVGAALGIDRYDEAALKDLSDNVLVAIRMERVGPSLVDFHTVQKRAEIARDISIRTRRESLTLFTSKEKKVDTILTRREYRVGILATAALASRDGSARLEKIAAALRSPCYTPYLGRMSCPFGLPFYPFISEAPCVRDAFRNFDEAKTDEIRAFEKEFDLVGKPFLISADTELALDGRTRVDHRRDVLTSSRRRQFATRSEDVAVFAPEEARKGITP